MTSQTARQHVSKRYPGVNPAPTPSLAQKGLAAGRAYWMPVAAAAAAVGFLVLADRG